MSKKRERNVVNFGFCFFGTKVLRHCRCFAACQVCLVVCSAAVAVAAASSLAVAYLEALWHCQLRCAGFCGIAFKLIVLHISVATTPAGISHAFKAPQLCSNPFFPLSGCRLLLFYVERRLAACCFRCLSRSQNTSTLRASLFPVAFLWLPPLACCKPPPPPTAASSWPRLRANDDNCFSFSGRGFDFGLSFCFCFCLCFAFARFLLRFFFH